MAETELDADGVAPELPGVFRTLQVFRAEADVAQVPNPNPNPSPNPSPEPNQKHIVTVGASMGGYAALLHIPRGDSPPCGAGACDSP